MMHGQKIIKLIMKMLHEQELEDRDKLQ